MEEVRSRGEPVQEVRSSPTAVRLKTAQVELLYAQARPGMVGAWLSVLIVAAGLRHEMPLSWLLGWLVVYGVVQVPRQVLVTRFFAKRPAGEDALRWGHYFTALTIASGACWGMAGVALFPTHSPAHQLFLAICIAGIGSAAAVIYSPLVSCYLPTVLLTVLPLSVRFLSSGDEVHVLMGAVIGLFATVLVALGNHMHGVDRDALKLRFEKNDLIQSLFERKAQAEALNVRLQAEIEERKRTENALKKSEQRLELALKAAELGMWEWEVRTNRITFGFEWISILEYTPDDPESSAAAWPDLVQRDDRERVKREIQTHLSGQTAFYETEFRLRAKSGRWKWMLARGTVVRRDDKGEPLVMAGTYLDITDRKEAEQALEFEKQRFQILSESAPFGMVMIDRSGRFLYVNPMFEELFGYNLRDVPDGRAWFRLAFPDDSYRQLVITAWKDNMGAALPGECREETFTVNCKDSSRKMISFRTVGLENGHYLTTCQDITELKRTEKALLESEKRYRSLVETMNEGLGGLDDRGAITYVNDRLSETLGYAREELIGRHAVDFVDPRFRHRLDELVAQRQRGPTASYELTWLSKDGRSIPTIMSPRAVFDALGNYTGSFAVITDVTALKAAEEQIRASLREKEILLREIHHRVKNNLQVMTSLLRFHSRHAKDSSQVDMFTDAENRVRSMALLHEKLYRTRNFASLNVREYLESLTSHLLSSYCETGANVTIHADVAKVSLSVDTGIPLGFIITELVSNGLKHAFPGNRKGEVSLRLRSIGEKEFELLVHDNGVGFPQGVDFENPTSMGMELVHIFVRQLRGTVEFRRDGGTEVRIVFKEIERPRSS